MKRLILGLALLTAVAVPAASVHAATSSITPSSRLSGALRTPDYHLAGDVVTFSVTLTNSSSTSKTLPVNFHVNRVLTYEGQNVTSGYPALTLRGDAAKRTTQARVVGSEQSKTVTVAGNSSKTVSFTTTLDECGYFQVDTNTISNGVKRHLAGTFVRVLGCFGVCHYAGADNKAGSNQYIYFPIPEQLQAARQHIKHMDEPHEFDYFATAEDRAHYDLHKAGLAGHAKPGARKCVSTEPTGFPNNEHDEHFA